VIARNLLTPAGHGVWTAADAVADLLATSVTLVEVQALHISIRV
jgi:hypothetical protein